MNETGQGRLTNSYVLRCGSPSCVTHMVFPFWATQNEALETAARSGWTETERGWICHNCSKGKAGHIDVLASLGLDTIRMDEVESDPA